MNSGWLTNLEGRHWSSKLSVRPNIGVSRDSVWSQIEFMFASAAVFLAPFNFVRYPSLYITLGDVFSVMCVVTLLATRTFPLRPLGPITPVWMAGGIMLITALLLSSLFYGDPKRGIVVSLQYFFCFFLLPVVIAWRPLPQVVIMVKVLVFSIILTCLFGIYLINIDGQTDTIFVSGNGRMMSFVERQNECAALIAQTVPLACWLRNTGRMSLPYFWFTLIILSYGIILTGSNSGAFALIFLLSMQFLINFSWKNVVVGGIIVSGLAFAAANEGVGYLPAAFQKRVLGVLTSGDLEQAGTFLDRVALIKESFGIASKNGLLGIGADQFEVISFYLTPVHNFYMLIWCEGGFIAFCGYLLLLVSGFMISILALKNSGKPMSGLCTLTMFFTFTLLTNAFTHIYARFWFVPILLAISISISSLYELPRPTGNLASMRPKNGL
jgi:O-Antigen ligase